jgi:hypothetical protein
MSLHHLNQLIAIIQFQLISNQKLSALLQAYQKLAQEYPNGNWEPIATKIHFSMFSQLDVSPLTAYDELLVVAPILKEEFLYRIDKENGKLLK